MYNMNMLKSSLVLKTATCPWLWVVVLVGKSVVVEQYDIPDVVFIGHAVSPTDTSWIGTWLTARLALRLLS